jgi:thymidylate synthase (FAD)
MKKEDISVKLLDVMGNDYDIEKAARISYDKHEEDRPIEKTIDLIRYLFWNRHTSPFEMVEFKFLLRIPIYVARQMVRHRTASLNELSRRYTNENISFYNAELRLVDISKTKQGSGEVVPEDSHLYNTVHLLEKLILESYEDLIDENVSNETARIILPHSLMTTWIWKINLHNLLHFLNLRMDNNSQKEIQMVAELLYGYVDSVCPITAAAFRDWKEMHDIFKKVGYKYFKTKNIDEFIKKMGDFL